MNRLQLIQALSDYRTTFEEELSFIPRFKSLLTNFTECYNRSLTTGHITASAWIIDNLGTYALLINHKKLNKWLQPGGHADGDENVKAVALKEAKEETGLYSIRSYNDKLFDIDIHLIPSYKEIPTHFHYDIRFLFIADRSENIILNKESKDFAWIPLDKICDHAMNNISINRMVLKSRLIFK